MTSQDELGLGELVERLRTHADDCERLSMPEGRPALSREAAAALTSLIAERDGAVAALSGLVHFQGALTKSQFRDAAADALAQIGRKPIPMSDQSPFVTRAETAEAQLKAAREALEPFAEAAENLDDNHADGSPIWETPAAMGIDARHLRRARTAFSKITEAKNG